MKFKFSARGTMFHGKPHEEIAGICKKAGFRGIEGADSMFRDTPDAVLSDIRKIYESNGVRMMTFHLPSGIDDDISSFYESLRKPAVFKIRKWMDKAKTLGADIGILHPTTNRLDASIEGADGYIRQLGKSLEEILRAAESISFTIALENMMLLPEVPSRFGAFPEHIRLIKENFSHGNLGFCYDSGHALIAGKKNAALILEEMSPSLKAFHLQDNAGDRDSHLAPGLGLVDWENVFCKIKEISFSGYAAIEAPPFAPGPDYDIAAWNGLLRETEELAKKPSACNKAKP